MTRLLRTRTLNVIPHLQYHIVPDATLSIDELLVLPYLDRLPTLMNKQPLLVGRGPGTAAAWPGCWATTSQRRSSAPLDAFTPVWIVDHPPACTPATSLPAPLSAPAPAPQAKLPGLATSTELCHALRRQGIQLGVAGGNLFASSLIFWHLTNVLSDRPLRYACACTPAHIPWALAVFAGKPPGASRHSLPPVATVTVTHLMARIACLPARPPARPASLLQPV